jgi:hypothetical protein
MRLAIGLVVAAITFGAAAPAALADDNGVYQAYVSRDADFTRLGKQLKKDSKAWVRSGRTKPEAVLATIKDTRAVCSDVLSALKSQDSSSDNGAKAKTHATRSVKALRASLAVLGGAIRARTAHHLAKAKRLAKKATALSSRSLKEERLARKFFKAAGVQVKS